MTSEELEKHRKRLFSRNPLLGGRFRKSAAKRLAERAISGDADAVKLLAEALTNSADRRVQSVASDALSRLTDSEAIEAFCQYLMANSSSAMLRVAEDRGYAPQDEARGALFYFITGQWGKYESLDFQEDRPLLRRGYDQASEEVRKRFLEAARTSGRSDILSASFAGSGKRLRLGDMGDSEWEAIVDGLRREGRWGEMWRLIFIAPVKWSAEMIMAMREAGWKAEEEALREELVEMCPRDGKKAVFVDGGHIKTLEGHGDGVQCLSITPDGSILASGSGDNTVRLWRLPDGEYIKTLERHIEGVGCLSITPDGRILASGGTHRDTTIRLWSLPDGEHIKTMMGYLGGEEGHRGNIKHLSITPDGKILASGSDDGTVRLWSLPDGQHIKTLEGHGSYGFCLSITPDGSILVSGSRDNTVRLWSLPDGEHIKTLEGHGDYVGCLSITPDGSILASGSADNTVCLRSLQWTKPLALARYEDLEYAQSVLRGGTLSENHRRGWQFLEALLRAKSR